MNAESKKSGIISFIGNRERRSEFLKDLPGDVFGGTAAMLVALPSAIAFGLVIFAPLGSGMAGAAAIGGIIGTIVLGLINPVLGGTNKLVSAPCAPAAAVLSAFVAEMALRPNIDQSIIPVFVTIVIIITGLLQFILGYLGGGKIIKYIPFPVVAGYLSGVGLLIFIGQLPKMLGVPKGMKFWESIFSPADWSFESIAIGGVTIAVMFLAPKIIKAIPAAIIALLAGIATYFVIGIFDNELLSLENNTHVIGALSASVKDLGNTISNRWTSFSSLELRSLVDLLIPSLTLAVLLSIDTLKTCVVLDALTFSRHNSNKELIGQGVGNVFAGLLCGIPGAGTMGATLVNLTSGAKSRFSGFLVGVTSLLVLLILGKLIAWIPIASLAGILIVVAIRMVDRKSFLLLKNKNTVFDFIIILGVVISAVVFDLITAAGVGIALAILLFLRVQLRSSVIRRYVFGNEFLSKKIRQPHEVEVLEEKGKQTIIVELQGELFFGSSDQLFTKLQPYLADCRYVIMDMRRVDSVDYTAVYALKQILARIKGKDGFLIFTSVPLSLPSGQNVKEYLNNLGLTETENLKFFDDLYSALEWVEDKILIEEKILDYDQLKILDMQDIEYFDGFSDQVLEKLTEYIDEVVYQPGEIIFRAGEESDEMFFVRKGSVKIFLSLTDGSQYHLMTIDRGGVFGDMAFIDREKRSADACAVTETHIYMLSRHEFTELSEKFPEVAGLFYERLASLIVARLRHTDKELKAFQES